MTEYHMPHNRAAAFIIRGSEILLMWRMKQGSKFYVFPGGFVERGEIPRHAALREVKEETTITASHPHLVFVHHYTDSGNRGYYYVCRYEDGEPHLPDDSEEALHMNDNPDNQYRPLWVPTLDLPCLLVYPLEIRDAVIDALARGFPEKAITTRLPAASLRQSL